MFDSWMDKRMVGIRTLSLMAAAWIFSGLSPSLSAQTCAGTIGSVTIPVDSPPTLFPIQLIYSPGATGIAYTVTTLFTDQPWAIMSSFSNTLTVTQMMIRFDTGDLAPGCYTANVFGGNIRSCPRFS